MQEMWICRRSGRVGRGTARGPGRNPPPRGKNPVNGALDFPNISDETRTPLGRPPRKAAPMPTSQARIDANRRNAQRSTGPRTEEGKQRSRANALKHGLTGAGVVLPEADAIEVERRAAAFAEGLNATGELGHALARRAALNSVRMERGADQQAAALSEHVRKVEAEFVPPEGVDDEEADRLRSEAVRRAMFDPSKEATLARKYEAAAERAFFRCLKELRQMERQAKADRKAEVDAMMASYLAAEERARREDAEFDAMFAERDVPMPRRPSNSPHLAPKTDGIDLPISAGRRR